MTPDCSGLPARPPGAGDKHTHVRPAPAARTRPEAPAAAAATGGGRARGARCPHAAPSAGIAASPARPTASRPAGGSGGGSRAWWARVVGRGGPGEAAARVDSAEPSKFLAGDVAGLGPLRTPGAVTGRPGRRGPGRPRRSSRTDHGLRRILRGAGAVTGGSGEGTRAAGPGNPRPYPAPYVPC
ncbi:uncharacterized protein LOC116093275 [Mastomys coucha]|uniref:uncharacterized protein LOC116093275 n=1 Tax=Mastomys coucha TaxID=35658 RepID=UPI001261AB06|nr:uncharacterized protein LOC116093275 [Mastomys coucha]